MGVYDELSKCVMGTRADHERLKQTADNVNREACLSGIYADQQGNIAQKPVDIDTVVYEIIGVCAIHGSNKEAVKLVREIVQRLVGPKL